MAANFAKYLTPPMPNVTPDYDGLEYRYKFLTFRPAYFKTEIYFLAAALFYVLVYYVGKKLNERRAYKWYEAHLLLYQAQFSRTSEDLNQDGNSDFFAFSTGRRALTTLHTTFTLRPRHDLLQMSYQFVRSLFELDYAVHDTVELEFTFRDAAGAVPECVWAVVAKDEMKQLRKDRWDLTFTKTTDNPAIDPSLVVMSEFADITANLFKSFGQFSLKSILSSSAHVPYLRSLSLTDQSRTRPSADDAPDHTKRLILSLVMPPASNPAATLPIVTAAFQLVDIIAGEGKLPGVRGGLNQALRPETRTKLRKTREEVGKEIKEEAAREKREEAEDEKAAARKKARDERLSKLSAAKQQKLVDREKKRAMRKTQGKVKTR